MKSLQLLAAMSVLALSVSACSTTNTATGGMPVMSGEPNPNTGKYAFPTPPVINPAPRT
jgi:hypothetical protein